MERDLRAMAALLLVLFTLQVSFRGSAAAPPPGSVKMTSFSYKGSGCPSGSTEGEMSSDAEALTVMFSSYYATTDEGLQKRKRSCIVSIGLSYPRGWIVAVGTVTTRGFAQLEKEVEGQIQTWYYFSGFPGTARFIRKLPVAFNDNFEFTDKFLTFIYSKCGFQRNLNLASEIKVKPLRSGKRGVIHVDSQDFSIKQVWQLVWERC